MYDETPFGFTISQLVMVSPVASPGPKQGCRNLHIASLYNPTKLSLDIDFVKLEFAKIKTQRKYFALV